MRWFKHFTRAHRDTKIKKLIQEYGAEGYAVYFYCLELIADTLEADNITFILEDDANLIADYLKIDSRKVEKIVKFLIQLELFGINEDGLITCFKMAKFLDERFTRNDGLKKIIRSERMQEIKALQEPKKGLLSSDNAQTIGDNPRQSRLDKSIYPEIRSETASSPKNTEKTEKTPAEAYCSWFNKISTMKNKGRLPAWCKQMRINGACTYDSKFCSGLFNKFMNEMKLFTNTENYFAIFKKRMVDQTLNENGWIRKAIKEFNNKGGNKYGGIAKKI